MSSHCTYRRTTEFWFWYFCAENRGESYTLVFIDRDFYSPSVGCRSPRVLRIWLNYLDPHVRTALSAANITVKVNAPNTCFCLMTFSRVGEHLNTNDAFAAAHFLVRPDTARFVNARKTNAIHTPCIRPVTDHTDEGASGLESLSTRCNIQFF